MTKIVSLLDNLTCTSISLVKLSILSFVNPISRKILSLFSGKGENVSSNRSKERPLILLQC